MTLFVLSLRWAYLIAVASFATVIVFTTGFALYQLYRDAINNSFVVADTHARSFEDSLTQTLKITELLVVNSLGIDDDSHPTARQKVNAIRDNFTTALTHTPFLRSLALLDEQRIVISSNPANLGHTVVTHDYLPTTEYERGLLRIGTPWFGRDIADGYPASPTNPIPGDALAFIPISKPLPLDQGQQSVLAAINPDFFINHILLALPLDEGVVEVVRLDGIVLLSSDPEQRPGSLSDAAASVYLFTDQSSAHLRYTAPQGREFLSAFRVSSLYPLAVIVHLDQTHVLVNFRRTATTLLWVVIPTLLVFLGFAALYWRRQQQLDHQREEAERLQRINAAQVFTHASEGIMITDGAANIIDVNAAFTTITGYERDEVLGCNPRFLKSDRQSTAFYVDMWAKLLAENHWRGEIWNRRKNGQTYAQSLNISVVRDRLGAIRNFVALLADITERKEYLKRLEFIAQHDVLTGLPNRFLLADRLHSAIAHVKRQGRRLLVAYLDLDGFKAVNDECGHAAGDTLLITVAQRIQHVIREGDTLARLGGDEFALILLNIDDNSEPLLNRILSAASQPVAIEGRTVQVSASLGVTFYPQTGNIDGEQLLRQADHAMYDAKNAGKNRFHYFAASP